MDVISEHLIILGPIDYVCAASIIVSVLSTLVSVAFYWNRVSNAIRFRWIRLSQRLSLGALVVVFCSALIVVENARDTIKECFVSSNCNRLENSDVYSDMVMIDPIVNGAIHEVPTSLSKLLIPKEVSRSLYVQMVVPGVVAIVGIFVLLGVFYSAYRHPFASVVALNSKKKVGIAFVTTTPLWVLLASVIVTLSVFYVQRTALYREYNKPSEMYSDCMSGRCPEHNKELYFENFYYGLLNETVQRFEKAKLISVVTTVLFVALMIFFMRRYFAFRRNYSTTTIGISFVLFLVSITLFLFTRSRADDTHRLIEPSQHLDSGYQYPGKTVLLKSCEKTIAPLTIVFPPISALPKMRGTWMVDRYLQTPKNLHDDLGTLKRNWEMLHPSDPNIKVIIPGLDKVPTTTRDTSSTSSSSDSPVNTIGVLADAQTPMAYVFPWIEAAVNSIAPEKIQIVTQQEVNVGTATLPNLKRNLFCGATLEINNDGTDLTKLSKWEDVARPITQGNRRVYIINNKHK